MPSPRRLSTVLLLTTALGMSALPTVRALYQPHSALVNVDPVDNTPNVKDGKVLAILPMTHPTSGQRVYVGGTFTTVKDSPNNVPGVPPEIARKGLFALDPVTNMIDPNFLPSTAGVDHFAVVQGSTDPVTGEETGNPRGVQSLAASPDGRYLYVGGDWSGGGKKVVKLDAATGEKINAFDAGVTSAVKDIVYSNGRLFIAGIFDKVHNSPRGGLAALDPETGALLPEVDIAFTSPRSGSLPRVESIAVTPDGKTLLAGGNFTEVDGQTRWQVALLDVTKGQAASLINWETSGYDDRKDDDDDPFACAEAFQTHVKDLDFSPDGSYFVIVTTGGYTSRGPLCDTAARWETGARGTGIQPTWSDYDGGDSMTGVAVTGSAVYVSGHMRWMNNFHNEGSNTDAVAGPGSVEREGIAALDPASGLPLPWNPGRERGHGAEALISVGDGLWVGMDTDRIGGERHEKLAFLPLAGGATPGSFPVHQLPGDLYSVSAAGLSRRPFNGAALGQPLILPSSFAWSDVRGAFAIGQMLYTGMKDGRLLRWPFTGNTLGSPVEVDMRGLQSAGGAEFSKSDVGKISGMFYDKGRIYYTKAGDATMHWRNFLPQANVADDVIGDREFDVPGTRNWGAVKGMTLSGGDLYFVEGTTLYKMPFGAGNPNGTPVAIGTDAAMAGTGLFVMPNEAVAPPGSIDPPGVVTPPTTTQPGVVTPARSGYWMVGSDGKVYSFGDAQHLGDAKGALGASKAVDLEPTPTDKGYWIVDEEGRVFGYGDAAYKGNADRSVLAAGEKITSLSGTPSGQGYWIFTSRGRALTFGDAAHFGDMSAVKLNAPVLDSIPMPSGKGYYMVAGDGGIFSFGDAKFYGSTGAMKLNAPVQSLVPDPDGAGYWLVASDGGVFAFEAGFRGSMGATKLNKPMTGMVPYGTGYLMVAEDGGIFDFSGSPDGFKGSLGANPPAHPIVSVAAVG